MKAADSACPLVHCCCVHVREQRLVGPTSCRAQLGQIVHPPLAAPARFRSLFWARWALFQKGLPKVICKLVTKYLTGTAFHAESEVLRQERVFPPPRPLPFRVCLEFATKVLTFETGVLIMEYCELLEPRVHYGQEPHAEKCVHRKRWMRVKRPPAEPIEFVWRNGVCAVRASSSLARPCDTLDPVEAPPTPELPEPPPL